MYHYGLVQPTVQSVLSAVTTSCFCRVSMTAHARGSWPVSSTQSLGAESPSSVYLTNLLVIEVPKYRNWFQPKLRNERKITTAMVNTAKGRSYFQFFFLVWELPEVLLFGLLLEDGGRGNCILPGVSSKVGLPSEKREKEKETFTGNWFNLIMLTVRIDWRWYYIQGILNDKSIIASLGPISSYTC